MPMDRTAKKRDSAEQELPFVKSQDSHSETDGRDAVKRKSRRSSNPERKSFAAKNLSEEGIAEIRNKRNHSAAKKAGITHIGCPRSVFTPFSQVLCEISRSTGRKMRSFDLLRDYPEVFAAAYEFIARRVAADEGFVVEIKLEKLGRRASRTVNIVTAPDCVNLLTADAQPAPNLAANALEIPPPQTS